MFENQIKAKHGESVLLPRLDAGSTPASSTKNCKVPISKLLKAEIGTQFSENGTLLGTLFQKQVLKSTMSRSLW